MAKVILDTSMSAGGANPYLDSDNHINVDKLIALNDKIKDKVEEDAKPLAFYVIRRKAKPVKYSSALEKKMDLKYLSRRAIAVKRMSRMSEASTIRNLVILTVYDNDTLGSLAANVKQAIAAINVHMRKADKTKTTVIKQRGKIRAINTKEFNASADLMKAVLLEGGVKEKDIVLGQSMMGTTMLVKLGPSNVVSIGRSDIAKFKAAVKAQSEAAE